MLIMSLFTGQHHASCMRSGSVFMSGFTGHADFVSDARGLLLWCPSVSISCPNVLLPIASVTVSKALKSKYVNRC